MTWTAQKILQAIASLPLSGCVDIDDIVCLTGMERKQIARACDVLVERELVVRIKPGCYHCLPAGVVLIETGGAVKSGPQGETAAKRHTGTLRVKAWRAMRQRKKFSLKDIIVLVANGDERDIAGNVGKYLRALERTGYLTRMPRREPGLATTSNGHLRYLLVRDSGPLAPVSRTGKATVYDPNTEETHHVAEAP